MIFAGFGILILARQDARIADDGHEHSMEGNILNDNFFAK